ncbi:hypothetical protein KEM48_006651 [Puccinia striiformis f. sp. tritici PST-130]|nr:hypothetical protein KEM48_006651 [Puccinia striiformis f. sp. tritici PST-130]
MASQTITIPITLDFQITVGYSKPSIGKLAKPEPNEVLPIGRAFQFHASRVLNNWTLSEQEDAIAKELEAAKNDSSSDLGEEVDDGVGDEPESRYLLELDPRDWKNQDQYAVLGYLLYVGRLHPIKSSELTGKRFCVIILTKKRDKPVTLMMIAFSSVSLKPTRHYQTQ